MKLKTFAAVAALSICAHAYAAPPISAEHAWVRWLPSDLPAAGYVTLANAGDASVDLVGIASPDYRMAMLHRSISNGSTEQMVKVDKLTIPAHGKVDIAPGGYHLMLEHAKHAIKPGDTVHLRLTFSDGETLDAPFVVKSPAATH